MQTASANLTHDTILGHPKGLFVCFATELWERFSFYGMKALLLLYVTKYHLFSDDVGFDVMGAYAGLGYSLPVLGGLIADRYLGMRKAVFFGGILLVLGHIGMAFEGTAAKLVDGVVVRDESALMMFYLSLSLIVVGLGFLKPNISTIVGRLYGENDPRRDAGFTIFYMGINTGSLVATILCGWLGETYGWGYGFGVAGIGMVLGLFTFVIGSKHFHGVAEPPYPEDLKKSVFVGLSKETAIYAGAIASLSVVWLLLRYNSSFSFDFQVLGSQIGIHGAVHTLLLIASIAVLSWFVWYLKNYCSNIERSQMSVLMILIFSSVVFWALFEQTANSMTLFSDRVLDRHIFGYEVKASQIQSLNPLFIILLAPLFAMMWVALAKRDLEPSTPVKFALAIIQVALGMGILVVGIAATEPGQFIAFGWIVLGYLLITTGELCLSPVGLSAVTKLSIPKVVGVMMGTWFLATAYAENLAAQLSKIASMPTDGGQVTDVAKAAATYGELFSMLFWIGLGVGLFMLMISPLLRKGMRGIH
jgi:POT family proton-dependent oligopeptide transporter